jgi:hypothetical protein
MQQIGKIPSIMQATLEAQQDYSRAEAAVATHESILHHMCSDLSTWASWKSVEAQIRRIDALKQDAFERLARIDDLKAIKDQTFRPQINNSFKGWV